MLYPVSGTREDVSIIFLKVMKSIWKDHSVKTCTLWIPVFHITSMNGFHMVQIFSKRYFPADMLRYLLVLIQKSICVSTKYFYK